MKTQAPDVRLIPLGSDSPSFLWTSFAGIYSRARQQDPVVFPEQSVLIRRMKNDEVIAAMVYEDTNPLGAFVLDVDRDHDALCCLVVAGRHFDRWGPALDALAEQAASKLGVSRLWVQGRRGWAPTLREHGFKPKYVVYARELGNGVWGQRGQQQSVEQ